MKIQKIRINFEDIKSMFSQNTAFECQRIFDNWFEEHVEPVNKILENSAEVYGSICGKADRWSMFEKPHKKSPHTHKALLINIEPIKKDAAEDVLRDLLASEEIFMSVDLYERAKAVLEIE